MKPIGYLMIEHRLIDRMIDMMKDEIDWIGEYRRVDPLFIEAAVYFIRSYTDISHHGKEEKIYFQALEKKPLTGELKKIMSDLVQEHAFARKTVDDIEHAKESYSRGEKDALAKVIAALNIITIFYPQHMEKEEKHFFYQSMEYLSPEEKDKMLADFAEFDSRLFHAEHIRIIEELEQRRREQKGGAPSGARA